ncbi:MAG: hypothetical protein HC822_07545 [Oscillochloris sp.]|nr:hypothetical protein [Oscillochloris sp.]
MHRFGWILLVLGVVALFGRGALFVLPLLFLPLLFGAIFFGLMSMRHGHAHHCGPRSYHWRGCHGYYDQSSREGERREPNTGETTRL